MLYRQDVRRLKGYRLGIDLTMLLVFGVIEILVNERVLEYMEFYRMPKEEKR